MALKFNTKPRVIQIQKFLFSTSFNLVNELFFSLSSHLFGKTIHQIYLSSHNLLKGQSTNKHRLYYLTEKKKSCTNIVFLLLNSICFILLLKCIETERTLHKYMMKISFFYFIFSLPMIIDKSLLLLR
jgi:hypothetical protein